MCDPRLAALIRQSSVPLPLLPPPPLPPNLEALVYPGGLLPPLEAIHAVIFDVYGTLFISAAGDISTGDDSGGNSAASGPRPPSRQSLESLAGEYGISAEGPGAEALRGYFRREVLKRHGELRAQTAYPELRAEELWAGLLARRGAGARGAGLLADESRELALRYELAVNPVYPMPGAEETLAILRDRGIALGLISNAQFFTPLLFEAFFGAVPAAPGFDPGLLIYSYELGEAKPSPNLFAPAVRRLEALGLKPENALYVGNDMLNDIFAGARAGFKTALFAGDGRSLRLREGDSRIRGLTPDRVVRNLRELILLLSML